jgi:hypothetical protein
VEELVAGTFAPGLFDLLTGTAEAGTYSTEEDWGRPPAQTIPDSE